MATQLAMVTERTDGPAGTAPHGREVDDNKAITFLQLGVLLNALDVVNRSAHGIKWKRGRGVRVVKGKGGGGV